MIKRKMSNILIVIGLLLIIYSGYFMFEWHFIQTPNPVLIEVNIEEEVTKLKDERVYETKKETVADEKEEPVYEFKTSREAYEDGMMSIQIPKLEVEAKVMSGTSKSQLKKGPGLYDISPLTYESNGNVLIAAHRTTYGKWFRNVDKLVEGDSIIIDFENHQFNYEVERVFIVAHNDWSVTEQQGYSALTLTACHPLYSAKQRIVVRAKLINISDMLDQ